MKLLDQIMLISAVFAEARGVGRKRVSTLAFNRGSKLDEIADGSADINTKTFERAMVWFSSNWPSGAVWPPAIHRPEIKMEELSDV